MRVFTPCQMLRPTHNTYKPSPTPISHSQFRHLHPFVEMSEQIKGDFVSGIGDLGFFYSCVGLCATWECAYNQE